jgi:predicted nucleotidyltransferase component of viral defense system
VSCSNTCPSAPGSVFKGGTCLTKVHGSLYRLSEDLDFSISTQPGARRQNRSRSISPVAAALETLPDRLPGLRILEPLRGFNNSTQYNAVVGYESLLDGHFEPLRIEISVREPMLLDVHVGAGTTLLLDPISAGPLVETFPVPSLAYREAMAEKLRAALCRPEVAIRDFFDVDHAVRAGFDPLEPEMLDLTRRKVAVPGTAALDVSEDRLRALELQLETQLRPVLRERDFARFELGRAVELVRSVARKLHPSATART